jgi:hypothetical protein
METKKDFTMTGYTGTDNLEAIQMAVNYNRFLISLITGRKVSTTDKILDIGAGICHGVKKKILLKKYQNTSEAVRTFGTASGFSFTQFLVQCQYKFELFFSTIFDENNTLIAISTL